MDGRGGVEDDGIVLSIPAVHRHRYFVHCAAKVLGLEWGVSLCYCGR